MKWQAELDLAVSAARQAAACMARDFALDAGVRSLEGRDIKTQADVAAEAVILEALQPSGLPALADAALILSSQAAIDWEWLEQLAGTARLEAPIGAALDVLGRDLGLPVPGRLLAAPPARSFVRVSRPASPSKLYKLRRHWQRFRRLAQAQQLTPWPWRFIEYLQQRAAVD